MCIANEIILCSNSRANDTRYIYRWTESHETTGKGKGDHVYECKGDHACKYNAMCNRMFSSVHRNTSSSSLCVGLIYRIIEEISTEKGSQAVPTSYRPLETCSLHLHDNCHMQPHTELPTLRKYLPGLYTRSADH